MNSTSSRSERVRAGSALGSAGLWSVIVVLGLSTAAMAAFPPPSHDKSAWITRTADILRTGQFPLIDSFMWFNFDNSAAPDGIDWRIQEADGSAAAYRNANWGSIQQGAFIQGFPTDINAVNAYKTLTQANPLARVGWHMSMNTSFPQAAVNQVIANGSSPYLVWEPYDSNTPNSSILQQIVDGDWDQEVRSWAESARGYGKPIEVSFGHEMNSDWYSWGYLNNHNGNTPSLFADAFRHVVNEADRWAQQGFGDAKANINWVWNPNASYMDDYSAAFPTGDPNSVRSSYVDRIGLTGFNWGRRPRPADQNQWQWDDWRDFESIFGSWKPGQFSNYDTVAALGNNQIPIIIAEFSTNTPEPASLVLLALGGLVLIRRKRR